MKNIKNNWFFFALSVFLSLAFGYVLAMYDVYALLLLAGVIGFFVLVRYVFKNPFTGLLIIIFFLPFTRIPNIDIGPISLQINQLVGLITLLSFALSVLVNKEKIRSFALTWPLILFWTALIISLFFTGDITRSLTVFVFVIFTSLFSLLPNQYIDTKEKLEKIIVVIFWSTLVVCIFGIFQFLGDTIGLPTSITGLREGYTSAVFGFPRVQAFSIEPLYLGNFLLFPLGIFLALFLSKTKVKFLTRPILFGIIFLIILIIALTVSRGAYLALGVMLVVMFVFMAKKFLTPKIIAVALITLLLGSAAVIWFINKGEDKAYEEFIKHVTVEDFTEGESVQGRFIEYERALELAEDNPTYGIGIGAYGVTKKGFPDHDDISDYDIVNNQYIELLTETGWVGLMAFIFMIIFVIWRGIIAFYATHDKMIKFILVGLLGAFVGTMVQYNFFSTLYIIPIWILIGTFIAVQNLGLKDDK